MVSALTHNSIFGRPFRSQASGFLAGTNRAISLLSVLTVEWMTVFARDLLCVHSLRIFNRCYNTEMNWIYTIPHAAQMIYNQTIRYVTNKYVIRNSMCAARQPSKKEGPVPVFVEIAFPTKTLTDYFILVSKPNQLLLSTSFHIPSLLPLMPSILTWES